MMPAVVPFLVRLLMIWSISFAPNYQTFGSILSTRLELPKICPTTNGQIHTTIRCLQKIVHFDLKGAPPTLQYYEIMFPLLKRLQVHAVLMEYEDMFPYWNELNILRRPISYNSSVLKAILELASDNNLEVIPLVQTFGHMEFVLKHPKYSMFREDVHKLDTICPSDNGSYLIIMEMLRQVRILHPNAKRLHIGADEAYSIAKDARCLNRLVSELDFSVDRLKLNHITRVAEYARNKLGFTEVLAWNDMFGDIEVALLKEYKMGELIVPVIWGYAVDVTKDGYFPTGMFGRYRQVFPKMLFASAFKGANGQSEPFCNIQRYFATQRSYVTLYRKEQKNLEGKISGIILTGWQRYSHDRPLCEILPVSIPSLIIDLIYLNNIELNEREVIEKAMIVLGCVNKATEVSSRQTTTRSNATGKNDEDYEQPSLEAMFMNCSFPGSKIYDEMQKLHQHATKEKMRTADLETVRTKIGGLLQPYFYDESIKEILEEQLTSRNIGMDHNVR